MGLLGDQEKVALFASWDPRRVDDDRIRGCDAHLRRVAMISKRALYRLYHSEQLSYDGISERLGVSKTHVGRLMKQHRIPVRSARVALEVGRRRGRMPGLPARKVEPKPREETPIDVLAARARWALQKALSRGDVFRPDHCSRCKKKCRPEGRQNDPREPFQVEWLCRSCNREGG